MDLLSIAFIILFIVSLPLSRFLSLSIEKHLSYIVILLVLTISSWSSSSIKSNPAIFNLLFNSFLIAIFTILFSYLIGNAFKGEVQTLSKSRIRTNYNFLIALVIGWLIGLFLPSELPYREVISVELLILAIVAGLSVGHSFSFQLIKKSSRVALISIISAFIGSFLAGLFAYFILNLDLKTSFAVTFGMGWYTYAGPLVATYKGPTLGSIAFLANFLREQLTFLIVPFLKGKAHALISIGGATAMDDTLPVYISRLGKEYSIPAISSGLILTLAVPFLLPFFLSD